MDHTGRIKIVSFAVALLLAMLVSAAVFLTPRNLPRGYGESKALCASHLHQIGLAMLLYENDHGGQYPDSFSTMLREEQLPPYALVCPASQDEATTAPTTQAQADDLANPGHVSYIYLGNGLNNKTALPNQILAYEPLSNHGDGICVLCGDGHSEFVNITRSQAIIAAAATTRPVMLPP